MAILGEITVNEILILEVDENPISSPIEAPIGSLAVMTDGSAEYHKFGPNNNDWAPTNNVNSIINSLVYG
jgi:hypothetical protein